MEDYCPNKKDIAVIPIFCSYFHGETWYKCPTCERSFEYYDAFFNEHRCPYCGQLINQS